MNIVVDAGNTYLKAGWFEGDQLIRREARISFMQLAAAVRSAPADYLLFSSVSPRAEELQDLVQPSTRVWHLDSTTPLPISKNYDTPHTLGMDRLAAAVGAVVLFPKQDRLVIDMGTCVTYDWVDSGECFQGGAISPGLRMRLKAMHSFTKRLPLVEDLVPAPPLVGKTTHQALLSGALNGLLAELNGMIIAHRAARPDCQIVLCGGDCVYFETLLPADTTVSAELVLIGLNRILQYNVKLQNL